MKWEYLCVHLYAEPIKGSNFEKIYYQDWLDANSKGMIYNVPICELGDEGWELVGILDGNHGIFKRPIEPTIKEVICNICEKNPEMHDIVFKKNCPSCVPNYGWLSFDKDGHVNHKCVYNKEE